MLLIFNNIGSKTEIVTRDKRAFYSVKTIISLGKYSHIICSLNKIMPKYIKQKLTELKEGMGNIYRTQLK